MPDFYADFRRDEEISLWKNRAHDDASLISKLQMNIRQLIARIEELEEELESEQRARNRVRKEAEKRMGLGRETKK